MITPKRFDMENPIMCWIDITIDPIHIPFIESIPYVSRVDIDKHFVDCFTIWIDKRYDLEEAWLDLYERLTVETEEIKLDSRWDLDGALS